MEYYYTELGGIKVSHIEIDGFGFIDIVAKTELSFKKQKSLADFLFEANRLYIGLKQLELQNYKVKIKS